MATEMCYNCHAEVPEGWADKGYPGCPACDDTMATEKKAGSVWYWRMPAGPWFVSVREGSTMDSDEIETKVAASQPKAKAMAQIFAAKYSVAVHKG